VARIDGGEIAGVAGGGLVESAPESRVLAVEQSNSSIIYGERVFLKLYRRLEEGVNPDAEILRFLGARSFPQVPPFRGALEFRRAGRAPQVLALATGMVANNGDAWSFTLRELTRQLECVVAGDANGAKQIEAVYVARAAQLGQRTGALHLALAADVDDANFAPEPLTAADFAELAETVRTTADQVLTGLSGRLDALDPAARRFASELLSAEPALRARIAALDAQPVAAAKTRTHGDYHLGQVLNAGGDFVIIDFEGEPARPLAERRRKRSPLRDVAGMLRSFHYAAHSALGTFTERRVELEPHAERWHERARSAFLSAWIETTAGASFVPVERAEFARLLDAFLLEKALYEVAYELNNRPAWLGIPLRGAVQILRGVR
jgi:maltose alpha-D-glucosyltransferase / alpha-amylase